MPPLPHSNPLFIMYHASQMDGKIVNEYCAKDIQPKESKPPQVHRTRMKDFSAKIDSIKSKVVRHLQDVMLMPHSEEKMKS